MKPMIKRLPNGKRIAPGKPVRFAINLPNGFVGSVVVVDDLTMYSERGKGSKKHKGHVELWMWQTMAAIIDHCESK